jgi:histidine triad (HIT) family protein
MGWVLGKNMENCLFCKFVDKTIPVEAVYEDEECLAIRDIAPRAPVHLLVIPKAHVPHSLELAADQEKLAGHLVRVAARLAEKEGLSRSGFRLIFNTLQDAGQTVFHLHLHLMGGRPLGPMG